MSTVYYIERAVDQLDVLSVVNKFPGSSSSRIAPNRRGYLCVIPTAKGTGRK